MFLRQSNGGFGSPQGVHTWGSCRPASCARRSSTDTGRSAWFCPHSVPGVLMTEGVHRAGLAQEGPKGGTENEGVRLKLMVRPRDRETRRGTASRGTRVFVLKKQEDIARRHPRQALDEPRGAPEKTTNIAKGEGSTHNLKSSRTFWNTLWLAYQASNNSLSPILAG